VRGRNDLDCLSYFGFDPNQRYKIIVSKRAYYWPEKNYNKFFVQNKNLKNAYPPKEGLNFADQTYDWLD